MPVRYHIGPCPMCRQAHVELFRALPSGDVYGHCGECEQGFRTPTDLARPGGGFLALLDDEAVEPATEEEIARSVWANHPVGSIGD